MKKILGFIAISMLAFGSFGAAHADTPACAGPATLGPCTYTDSSGNTQTCANLWVQAGTPVDGCVA
ncbi:MAG: hypothetical protein ACYDCC_02455 [Actinomycetota bacterium]